MNWTDEPATESQVGHLRQFGYQPEHALTKGEASHLISDFEQQSTRQEATAAVSVLETPANEAAQLRIAVEEARRTASENELAAAIAKRQDFWVDTCRDPTQRHTGLAQVLDFYMKYGCRFVEPTHQQVQAILDALDPPMSDWDQEHPELFYQTLELNFPELVRRH